ncbi:MAG: DoxX family protein [Xanthomonadales bacterium]|nr:DoxX family protein [Xanthomonadales bacterium]
MQLLVKLQQFMDAVRRIDFLGPVALRIYLAPIFILAGFNKLSNAENVASYFEYLGMPFPQLMVYLAGGTEFFGGILLVLGLAVRWITIPLMFTMIVAAATAHWENGWHALPETELQVPWEWRSDLIDDAIEKREMARSILREHGNYEWLTGAGPITILKNGIEFAATYFIMLLALWGLGAGRYLSADYWLRRKFMPDDEASAGSYG